MYEISMIQLLNIHYICIRTTLYLALILIQKICLKNYKNVFLKYFINGVLLGQKKTFFDINECCIFDRKVSCLEIFQTIST